MSQEKQYTHNWRLDIMYDGTQYCGWQIQPHSISIQEIITNVIQTITRHNVSLIGSGRTDSGVHALNQVAHFKTYQELDTSSFFRSINGMLPKDIRVKSITAVPLNFHAQLSAKGKIYHYHIVQGPIIAPFKRLYAYHHPKTFDVQLLKDAASKFLGTHDFTSFANSAHEGSAAKNPVRTIYRLDVIEDEGTIRLEFEGNGFLYKMVRNIVGMLLEVAQGRRPIHEIELLFQAKDRRLAPKAAPANGLFLVQVFY